MKKVMIYVAAHKECQLQTSERCYHILQVGAANAERKFGEFLDDAGDNMSALNPIYCELTGYYWILRNGKECDYVGLMHYRRYLGMREYAFDSTANILTEKQIIDAMQSHDFIMPTAVKKNIHNKHHRSEDTLFKDRSYAVIHPAVANVAPEYLDAVKAAAMSPTMMFGNILITSMARFKAYAEWLFRIEDEIVRLVKENDDTVRPRELGYLSERLLNAYLMHHREFKVKHFPVHYTEKTNNVNYVARVVAERAGLMRFRDAV